MSVLENKHSPASSSRPCGADLPGGGHCTHDVNEAHAVGGMVTCAAQHQTKARLPLSVAIALDKVTQGVPEGGVALGSIDDLVGGTVAAAVPAVPERKVPREKTNKGKTTIFTGMWSSPVENTTPGVSVTSISRATRSDSLAEWMAASWPDADSAYQRALELERAVNPGDEAAGMGPPVTILQRGETMLGATVLTAYEGRLWHRPGLELAMLPKGKRNHGFRIEPGKIIDVVPGFGGAEALYEKADALFDAAPALSELTKEDLASLPDYEVNDGPTPVPMVLFGATSTPMGRPPGAMWFVTDYDPENDIVNGYWRAPEASGLDSESSSAYGKDLFGRFAKAEVREGLTLADAIEIGEMSDLEAFAAVRPLQ